MVVKLLLDAKREGKELDPNDIRELIAAYTRGEVPDYQMSAFTMAVCCNGMTDAETFALTDAMRLSGVTIDWKDLSVPTADKHSTGGVGDKLSFIVQPLVASCGIAVPSLAGRGLGLTGGTIDKLESVPGVDTEFSVEDFKKCVKEFGVVIAAQTEEIAPADKKLYALRDVTGTVPSIPLIVASILSKKLAEGAETLVFDVKCGKGAFMKTQEDASKLAHALVNGAKAAGRKAAALVTRMDAPIGKAVGNFLEFFEACEFFEGGLVLPDVRYLSLELAATMVSLAKDMPFKEAREMCEKNLKNQKAYYKFMQMLHILGMDDEAMANYDGKLDSTPVYAPESGYIAGIDAEAVARAALDLGAGRKIATDDIHPFAGIVFKVQIGDEVEKGEVIAEFLTPQKDEAFLEMTERNIASAVEVSPTRVQPQKLILERVS